MPGKSPGMRGSFPAVGRGLSSLLPGIPGIQQPQSRPLQGLELVQRQAGLGRPGELWCTALGQGSDLLGSTGSGRKRSHFLR